MSEDDVLSYLYSHPIREKVGSYLTQMKANSREMDQCAGTFLSTRNLLDSIKQVKKSRPPPVHMLVFEENKI